MIRPRGMLGVFVALFLIAPGLPAAVAAQQKSEVEWSEPEVLQDPYVSSWFPEVTADNVGTVHLVWEATRDLTSPEVFDLNAGAIVYSQYTEDGGWSEPNDIYVKDVYNAARPIVWSDNHYVHVLARGLRDSSPRTMSAQNLAAIYHIRAPIESDHRDAQSWSPPIRLSTGAAYWGGIQTLPDGTLVVVYNELTTIMAGGNQETRTVLFSRSSPDFGTTWLDPVRISWSDERVARSSLVSLEDGTLVVAWDEGYDNLTGQGTPSGIYTAVSTDGGASWSEPQRIDTRGTVEQATLGVSGDSVMIVYRATDEDILLYHLSTDGGRTWTEDARIPDAVPRTFGGSHHFDKLALATDASGRIILAYVGQTEGTASGLSVMVASFQNGSWSTPDVVASPIGFPEYPRLTVLLGNQIFLAYFVRDEIFEDDGRYVIWTVTGTTDARPIPPASQQPEESDRARPTPESSADVAVVEFPPPPPPTSLDQTLSTDSIRPQDVIEHPMARSLVATALIVILSVGCWQIMRMLLRERI